MNVTRERQSSTEHQASESSIADSTASGLFATLAADVSDLLRSELKLAKTEVNESISNAKAGVAGIGVGVAVLLAGVLTLIAFVVLAVSDWFDLSLWLGALIVGALATVIGAVLVKKGGDQFSAESLRPSRTQAALSKDAKLVEETLS